MAAEQSSNPPYDSTEDNTIVKKFDAHTITESMKRRWPAHMTLGIGERHQVVDLLEAVVNIVKRAKLR